MLTMRTFIAAVILLAAAMPAVAHETVLSDGSVMDYSALKSPAGGSCCGKKDCHALASEEIRLSETGELEVLMRGTWWSALDPLWFSGESPDGSWHLCAMPRDVRPRCVFGGLGT